MLEPHSPRNHTAVSILALRGQEAGATVMEQGVNLLANFPLSSPFFSHYRNMRTSSKTIN